MELEEFLELELEEFLQKNISLVILFYLIKFHCSVAFTS